MYGCRRRASQLELDRIVGVGERQPAHLARPALTLPYAAAGERFGHGHAAQTAGASRVHVQALGSVHDEPAAFPIDGGGGDARGIARSTEAAVSLGDQQLGMVEAARELTRLRPIRFRSPSARG